MITRNQSGEGDLSPLAVIALAGLVFFNILVAIFKLGRLLLVSHNERVADAESEIAAGAEEFEDECSFRFRERNTEHYFQAVEKSRG